MWSFVCTGTCWVTPFGRLSQRSSCQMGEQQPTLKSAATTTPPAALEAIPAAARTASAGTTGLTAWALVSLVPAVWIRPSLGAAMHKHTPALRVMHHPLLILLGVQQVGLARTGSTQGDRWCVGGMRMNPHTLHKSSSHYRLQGRDSSRAQGGQGWGNHIPLLHRSSTRHHR